MNHTATVTVISRLAAVCALVAMTTWSHAQEQKVVEDIIIVVRPQEEKVSTGAVVVNPSEERRRPLTPEEAVWDNPNQLFANSRIGDVPLFTDIQGYADDGSPIVHIPDAATYALFKNGTPADAAVLLETRYAQARRYLEVSHIMQEVAHELGYVSPNDFMLGKSPDFVPADPSAYALNPRDALAEGSRGAPVLNIEQAQQLGLTAQQIPITPGVPKDVEVMWIWSPDCAICIDYAHGTGDAKTWGEFAASIKPLGARPIGVSIHPVKARTYSVLRFMAKELGWLTDRADNFLDYEEIGVNFNIEVTPTYIFINRKLGKLMRLEGRQTAESLQTTFLELIAAPEGTLWPPPMSLVTDDIGRQMVLPQPNPEQADDQPAHPSAKSATPLSELFGE